MRDPVRRGRRETALAVFTVPDRAIKLWTPSPFRIAGHASLYDTPSLYDTATASCWMRAFAGAFDQMRHRQNGRQHNIAPGGLERLDESLVGGETQVLIRQNRNRAAIAAIG